MTKEPLNKKTKVILVIITILILIVGVVIYLSLKNRGKNNIQGDTNDRGLLSIFGERKLKPLDENSVPGIIDNNGQDPLGGGDGGDTGNSGGTNGEPNDGNNTNNNAFAIRSVGTANLNENLQGGTSVGSSTGGNSGGTGGQQQTNPTSPGNITQPPNQIRQIDCTPPPLPYTNAEIKELKELTSRFFAIAAILRTENDVKNEIDTMNSYARTLNQANVYLNQCYQELKNPIHKNKAKDSSARWHPYLNQALISKIAKRDNRIVDATSSKIINLNQQISQIDSLILADQARINYLKQNSPTDAQTRYVVTLEQRILAWKKLRNEHVNEKANLTKIKQTGSLADVLGTFFSESNNKYKGVDFRVLRENINARRAKLLDYLGQYMHDSGNGDVWGYFYPGGSGWDANPLKHLWDERVRDSYLDVPVNPTIIPAPWPSSYVDRFKMLEEALRIW